MLQIPDQKVPLTADPEGVLYVSGTGVDLHSVVGMFEEGASAEEITFFKSVGVAVQDVAVAARVLERAEKLDLGSVLEI